MTRTGLMFGWAVTVAAELGKEVGMVSAAGGLTVVSRMVIWGFERVILAWL